MSLGHSFDPTLAAGTPSAAPDAFRKSAVLAAYAILWRADAVAAAVGGGAAARRLPRPSRPPIVLSFVTVASTRPEPARRGFVICFATVALGLLALRIWAVSENWREADRQFAEFRAVSRSLPEGSRLLVVQDLPQGPGRPLETVPPGLAQRHMPELAIIDRSAFIPYLFTDWTPVRPNPRNAAISESASIPVTPAELVASATPDGRSEFARPNELGQLPYWRNWPETFDFVLWINVAPGPPVLADRLQLWASGSFFRIYRITRP